MTSYNTEPHNTIDEDQSQQAKRRDLPSQANIKEGEERERIWEWKKKQLAQKYVALMVFQALCCIC